MSSHGAAGANTSTVPPPTIRCPWATTSVNLASTATRSVPATPWNSPRCVPRDVTRNTTRSFSASTCSARRRSGSGSRRAAASTLAKAPAPTAAPGLSVYRHAYRAQLVACLRDTEEIGVYSTGVGVPSKAAAVALGMTNAGRKYSVRGDFGLDGLTQAPAFRYETNIDSRALSIFRSDFPPMLGGKGPLTITIGDKSQALPLAGVAEPLRKFSATCFGKS